MLYTVIPVFVVGQYLPKLSFFKLNVIVTASSIVLPITFHGKSNGFASLLKPISGFHKLLLAFEIMSAL